MNIRQMKITDYDEIYALFLSCKGMGLNDLDDSKEGIDRFLKRNPDTCFVAESMGSIVGVIMVGNAFWEKMGFTTREDLVYRNRTITEMVRIDT